MIFGADGLRAALEDLLASIERSAGDELAEVDDAIVVVHVNYGAREVDGAAGPTEGEAGSTFYRSTSAKPHVQLGLVEQGRRAIERQQDSGE